MGDTVSHQNTAKQSRVGPWLCLPRGASALRGAALAGPTLGLEDRDLDQGALPDPSLELLRAAEPIQEAREDLMPPRRVDDGSRASSEVGPERPLQMKQE